MRALRLPDAEGRKTLLKEEILRTGRSRYIHRLHGVFLVCSGYSCAEAAGILGHSPRTIHNWVRRFENGGLEALRDAGRPGRPSCLKGETRERILGDLSRKPRDFGYVKGRWDAGLLRHHLEKHYGTRLGLRQCQRVLRESKDIGGHP